MYVCMYRGRPLATESVVFSMLQITSVQYVTAFSSGSALVGWLGSVVVARWTCDREVAGSTPGRCIAG